MFLGLPGATLMPGATLLPGSVGGEQHELTMSIRKAASVLPGWYLEISVDGTTQEIGYWPSSSYQGAMANMPEMFEVGGEVFDETSTWAVPMGSGIPPSAGYGQAAYHRNYFVEWGWPTLVFGSSDLEVKASQPSAYTYSNTNPVPPNADPMGWTSFFYFGNAQ